MASHQAADRRTTTSAADTASESTADNASKWKEKLDAAHPMRAAFHFDQSVCPADRSTMGASMHAAAVSPVLGAHTMTGCHRLQLPTAELLLWSAT